MAAKRCPMCRLIHPDRATRCECGYTFGQEIRSTLEQLDQQQTRGWATFLGGIGTLAGGILASVFTRAGLAIVLGGGGMTAAGWRKVVASRRSARELREKMQLPPARVVERD